MLRSRFITIALCALISVSAWSVTVDDLLPIRRSWTFTADEYTNNGTHWLFVLLSMIF